MIKQRVSKQLPAGDGLHLRHATHVDFETDLAVPGQFAFDLGFIGSSSSTAALQLTLGTIRKRCRKRPA